jgi:predicted nuclease of predicted toxin-antitoxin system
MAANVRIDFLIDAHLPIDQLRPLLEQRGHVVSPVQRQATDPAILARAEASASLI